MYKQAENTESQMISNLRNYLENTPKDTIKEIWSEIERQYPAGFIASEYLLELQVHYCNPIEQHWVLDELLDKQLYGSEVSEPFFLLI